MYLRNVLTALLLAAALSCSNASNIIGIDQQPLPETSSELDGGTQLPDMITPLDQKPIPEEDLLIFDAIAHPDIGPQCAPGEGCFLDPCEENGDCQSGWCVDHLGEGVCTIACSEECPAGWSCQQVAGTAPDLVFVCVSDFANLCRPCATGADCKSVGGAEDVCVQYGDEGFYCGGSCTSDEDCPLGFSCLTTVTVDGISTLQCVAKAGICPCTQKAVALALWTPCETETEFGICAGKRVCTAEGLGDCDALPATEEICNGLDDDCDGDVDEPALAEGSFLELCDDANDCTQDSCIGADGCTNAPLDEGECVDGDACTVGDHCEAGECVGLPILCDDSDPCTDDACDGLGGCAASPNTAPCDDSDPCTVNDICSAGKCVGFAIACDCQTEADCAALEDGNLCNGTLLCDISVLPQKCVVDPTTVSDCPEPPPGPDTICLEAACDPATGDCSLVPDHGGLACEDGTPCTVGDACLLGVCTAGVPANCSDDNPCSDDSCDLELGCVHANNAAPCDDGDVCTVGDTCSLGVCAGGEELQLCDDGNPCTDDSCDPGKGCQHLPIQLPCDDGNPCTTGEHCTDGWCGGGEQTTCDDGNYCTTDTCDAQSGCIYKLNALPCDDGDLCTTGDKCSGGGCLPSGEVNCSDDNYCTDDSCEPQLGCQYTNNNLECDDGDACTLGDGCSNGACLPGPEAPPCNDQNPCTDDSCDPETGCQHTANNLPCDDGNPCTTNEQCSNGWCLGGLLASCDDDNPCTTDSCDADGGCVYKLNTLACDDADICTLGDNCHLGECIGAISLQCDDNNSCTDDTCLPEEGCEYTPNSLGCNDGNACTTGDQCSGGWCAAAGVLNCHDDNPCTDDTCNPQLGCQYLDNNQACDDDNACSVGDACSGGACLPGPEAPDCDDQNPCTDDSCDPEDGCTHVDNKLACDDGNACTTGDACGGGACLPGPDSPDCDDQDQCTNDSCDPDLGCVNETFTPCCGNGEVEAGEACDDGNLNNGDGCSDQCALDNGCVILGQDVRTLEQGPDKWQLGYCQTLCENSQTTIPQGWHIATKAEVGFLTKHVKFGSCGAYGICGSYWYGGNLLTDSCGKLHYNCTTGGCWAYTSHCYTQVMLIKDGKDGTCLQ